MILCSPQSCPHQQTTPSSKTLSAHNSTPRSPLSNPKVNTPPHLSIPSNAPSTCPQSPPQDPSNHNPLLTSHSSDSHPSTCFAEISTILSYFARNGHLAPPLNNHRTSSTQHREPLPHMRRHNNIPYPRPRSPRRRQRLRPRNPIRCLDIREIRSSILYHVKQTLGRESIIACSSTYDSCLYTSSRIGGQMVTGWKRRGCDG